MSGAEETPEVEDGEERPPCERCGVFAQLFEYRSRELCRRCLGRRHRIDRLPLTVVTLVGGTLDMLRALGPKAVLGMLYIELVPALLYALGILPPLLDMVLPALLAPITVAMVFVLVESELGGDALSLPGAVGKALRAWPRLFAVQLSVGAMVGFGLLLCVLPGLYLGAGMAVAGPIAVNERVRGAGACIGRSQRRLKGHRWAAGIGYGLAFAPALWTQLALAVVVEALVTEVGLYDPLALGVLDFTTYLLTGTFMLPLFFTQAVLYAKTHPELAALEVGLAGEEAN